MSHAALELFRDLARRYSIAQRRSENMARCGRREDVDDAIAAKQEIELDFLDCFQLVRSAPRPRQP